MVLQWKWCMWSFNLRSPWYLVYMDPYFGLFPSMPLWDVYGIFWVRWSVHEGCEWSTKNRSLLTGENILCNLIGWWQSLTRAVMNSRKKFYWFINRVIIIKSRYIWIGIWAWHVFMPIAHLGCCVIKRLNYTVTHHRRVILIFLSNFKSFE